MSDDGISERARLFWKRSHQHAKQSHERLVSEYHLEHIATLTRYVIAPHGEFSEVYFPEWNHLLRNPETFATYVWNSPEEPRAYMAKQFPHLREGQG